MNDERYLPISSNTSIHSTKLTERSDENPVTEHTSLSDATMNLQDAKSEGYGDTDAEREEQVELLIARPDIDHPHSSDSDESEQSNEVDPEITDRLVSSIGATSVIDALEDMSYQRKATATEVAYLKHRYLKLCSCLSMSRDSEFELIQQAKRFTVELEQLNEELAKADTYPDNYNTQTDQMRAELLLAENQLLEREDRCDELSYILEGLQEEKRMLQREFDRIPKEEETKRLRRQLEQSIEELKLENSKKTGETRQLNQTLKDAQAALTAELKLVEEAKQKMEVLKNELNENKMIPLQHAKANDKIRKQIEDAQRLKAESMEENAQLREEYHSLDSLRIQMDIESAKLEEQSAMKHRKMFDTQSRYDAVNSQLDTIQQKAANLALEKAEMEMRMNQLMSERGLLEERVKRQTRERDQAIRLARKTETSLQYSKDAVKFAQILCNEKRAACANLKQAGKDKELIEKRQKLLTEVVALQEAVIKQSDCSEAELARAQKSLLQQNQMNLELADLRIETVELSRLATIKADEREQKARDFRTASTRYTRIRDEIKTKKLQIQEFEKALNETWRRSKDFAALYEAIKEERSNCLTLIQLAQQRIQESSEKMRICTNEIDVLRNNLAQKNDHISRQRVRLKSAITARDALRIEISKQTCEDRELTSLKDQLKISIDSQNASIAKRKQAMLDMKETMARVIRMRNDRAVQLIERNEELCVLQERIRIQESTQAHGEAELGALEEQIRWLTQEKRDLERSKELYTKKVADRRALENELTSRQIQLAICRDHVAQLETLVTDPTAPVRDPITGGPVCLDVVEAQVRRDGDSQQHPNSVTEPRARQLSGRDRDPAELRLKLDSIQCQLLSKERKLLEFNLLLEAINRLLEKLKNQTGLGKEVTLQLARKMNEHQTEVRETAKQLKASTAEMAMLMAIAFKLERQIQERRAKLNECYQRMKTGEVPCEEFEKAWKRYERRQSQKPIPIWEEFVYDDSWTTAQQRPNAYIPSAGSPRRSPDKLATNPVTGETPVKELATCFKSVPVPYGAQAPLRPNGPSANMRHFRKPKMPELEL